MAFFCIENYLKELLINNSVALTAAVKVFLLLSFICNNKLWRWYQTVTITVHFNESEEGETDSAADIRQNKAAETCAASSWTWKLIVFASAATTSHHILNNLNFELKPPQSSFSCLFVFFNLFLWTNNLFHPSTVFCFSLLSLFFPHLAD